VSDVEPAVSRPNRVRKFDRPPPPHDWRWWVGGLGKTLIATGLLLFGFVAYQLWGTGIETARAQDSLGNEFEELLATAPAATPSTTPSTTPTTTAAPASSSPVDSAPPDTETDTETDAGTETDDSVPAPTTPAPAPVASLPPIKEGDPIGRIEMPRIGVGKFVVAGVEKNDLKNGPGHYPETPMPGQLGNSAIAGHRTTFGQPFFDIDKLETGDEIIVTTLAGRFVYRVTGQQIVSPSDYQVVATTDPTTATLTLTSCHPKYTARERIIVSAELDAAASSPVGAATINYGRPLDDAVASDPDPSNTVVDPATADGTGTEAAGSVPVEDPTIAVDQTSTLDDGQIEEGIADAFSDGWFSDPGANSQVALWGLLLAAIGIVSYLISRTTKRDWIGLLVGVGPFVVTLYFFFQNANRLLPPNL
jgi:sortase A